MHPQRILLGPGSGSNLGEIIKDSGAKRCLVVSGRGSYSSSGADLLIRDATGTGALTRYCDFSPNPNVKELERALAVYENVAPDIVIGVGGGSAMDMAKLLRFFGSQSLAPEDYLDGKAQKASPALPSPPLIAIPTTSGSGSESTHFATLYLGHKKHSVSGDLLYPDVAIIDATLTESLPPYQTACTGFDALTQGIESYWCTNSNDESKGYAAEAITLCVKHLERTVATPTIELRAAIAKAANLAGRAINISKTTAAHAISYPMTAYFGVTHGQAVGVSLGALLRYNSQVSESDCRDHRGAAYVRQTIDELLALLQVNSVAEARGYLEHLLVSIGLKNRLSSMGIEKDEDVDLIVANGFDPNRVKNNPRSLDEAALRRLLEEIR